MNWNFMALPYFGHTPETSWQFGITGVYFFKTKHSSDFSDVNFDASYTLKNQWSINTNTRIHFNKGLRWYLDANLQAKRYPDRYWGTGKHNPTDYNGSYSITSDHINVEARPTFYIKNNIYIGTSLLIHYSNTTPLTIPLDTIASHFTTNGFGHTSYMAIGASFIYDTRENTYYPLKGIFAKVNAQYNQQFISNPTPSALFTIDYRHFVPIYREFILAYNIYAQFTAGNDIPFQLMPTIGGQDIIRGIYRNKFKDDFTVALQAELRIPIWRFLKATVFASVGDAYNYHKPMFGTPKVGYGAGLRARIHQAKTNIRFDVARNNLDNNWNFYITVKEAF